MQAVRTPVLGITLAVLLLFGETIGMRAYVAAHRPAAVAPIQAPSIMPRDLDKLIAELDRLEARVRVLSHDLARLRNSRSLMVGELDRIEARLRSFPPELARLRTRIR